MSRSSSSSASSGAAARKKNKKHFAALTAANQNPDENWRRMNANDGHAIGGARIPQQSAFTRLLSGIKSACNQVATRFFDTCG